MVTLTCQFHSISELTQSTPYASCIFYNSPHDRFDSPHVLGVLGLIRKWLPISLWCAILLLPFFGSKVDLPEKLGFGQGVPVSYGLAVLAVRRCLSRCDGVWVCCFPCFAAEAPWRHWFGAKWIFFGDKIHRREAITSQRWKASPLFWKDWASVSLPFLSEIAVSMISIDHRPPRPFI